jgi:hypothetical protein
MKLLRLFFGDRRGDDYLENSLYKNKIDYTVLYSYGRWSDELDAGMILEIIVKDVDKAMDIIKPILEGYKDKYDQSHVLVCVIPVDAYMI